MSINECINNKNVSINEWEILPKSFVKNHIIIDVKDPLSLLIQGSRFK
jgi:hypothetical protein